MALDKSKITSFRTYDGNIVKIEQFNSLSSSLEIARRYAKAGYPDRYVVFTEKQSLSPISGALLPEGEYEDGIFISIILRPAFFAAQASLIGPLSAVALITALEGHTTHQLGLGWVSDLYCEGEKIGGCSVEGRLDGSGSFEYMIVTFAVRVGNSFPPRLSDIVKKVFESEDDTIGMLMAKSVINKFFTVYSSLKSPAKYMDIYKRRFVLTGKSIKYIDEGKKVGCRVLDVDSETCALTVETRRGERIRISSPSSVIIPKRIKADKKS